MYRVVGVIGIKLMHHINVNSTNKAAYNYIFPHKSTKQLALDTYNCICGRYAINSCDTYLICTQ